MAGTFLFSGEECSPVAGTFLFSELGELVLGRRTGRADAQQVTFFKSVGLAVQDAVAARVAMENAARLKLGQEVAW